MEISKSFVAMITNVRIRWNQQHDNICWTNNWGDTGRFSLRMIDMRAKLFPEHIDSLGKRVLFAFHLGSSRSWNPRKSSIEIYMRLHTALVQRGSLPLRASDEGKEASLGSSNHFHSLDMISTADLVLYSLVIHTERNLICSREPAPIPH